MSTSYLPTPIPLGSPHLANPPMFDRWGLGTQRTRTDRRDYMRRTLGCDLCLLDLAGRSVLRCRTDDVSDAGIHAAAPVGFGLAIGQRYEVRMPGGSPEDGDGLLGISLGYATVIRTEVEVGDGDSDRIGFALRFDVPQLLPV